MSTHVLSAQGKKTKQDIEHRKQTSTAITLHGDNIQKNTNVLSSFSVSFFELESPTLSDQDDIKVLMIQLLSPQVWEDGMCLHTEG